MAPAPSHPSGILVDIVGTKADSQGRSCEEHDICGSVLGLDTLVRIRAVQVMGKEGEETALAVYWVTDGIDRCRVGFLPRHFIKHKKQYDGKLAQVVEILGESESPSKRQKSHRNKGICRAVLVEAEYPPKNKKRRRLNDDEEEKEEQKESISSNYK
jgi:hypothetical protein